MPQRPGPVPPRSLIEVLLYRKWTVLFWVIVGVGLGALHFHYAPEKFESTAEIVVLRPNAEAKPSPLSSAGLSTSAPSTHAAMLLSNTVLEHALKDPAIANSPLLSEVEHPLYFLRKEMKVKPEMFFPTLTGRSHSARRKSVRQMYFEARQLVSASRSAAGLPERES